MVERPTPKNKLSKEEREVIIQTVNQAAFKSLPPSQIVSRLADEGVYIASESTIYRVLKDADMQHHRGRSKSIYFYLYLILDLYSRKIIAWDVWLEESAENASLLVRRGTLSEQRVSSVQPLVLHSDNGSPMKGSSLLETLNQLGITPSRSPPRVSNDNPYAESIFRTYKYRPSYPAKGFSDLTAARTWVLSFVRWYNQEHRHSGLNFLTPNQRQEEIFQQRTKVYEEAKSLHPERWSKETRDWSLDKEVWRNPEKISQTITENKRTS